MLTLEFIIRIFVAALLAGTIIFQKNAVRGLTTAAGVWVTAAIGLACGAGMYLLATVSTILVLVGMEAFNYVLRQLNRLHGTDEEKGGDTTSRSGE